MIIGFIAADKQELFRDVTRGKGINIQVPHHVNGEILRVLNGSTGALPRGSRLPARWQWLSGELGEDAVLPKVVFPGPVAVKFAALSDTTGKVVSPLMPDGGELFVIAHALVIKDSGEEVWVAIDDSRGRGIATSSGLHLVTTVDLFGFAIDLALITSRRELKAVYGEVGQYSSLPALATTGLDRRFPTTP